MNTSTIRGGWVSMPLDEFERLIGDAAERSTTRAMTDVGLDGKGAATRYLRIVRAARGIQHYQADDLADLVRMVTTGFILALAVGVLIKLFEGGH